MPSPIAHSAVAILLWPALAKRGCGEPPVRLASVCGAALLGGLLVMLNAPDLDFLPQLLLGPETANRLLQHGGSTHSFFIGVVAAVLFASIYRPLMRMNWMRLFIVGLIAWWSHIIMDFFTWRGGVMALWPLTEQRFSSPIPLFYGARHSEPFAFHLHLITLSTEVLFGLVLWLAARSRCLKRIVSQRGCGRTEPSRAGPALEG